MLSGDFIFQDRRIQPLCHSSPLNNAQLTGTGVAHRLPALRTFRLKERADQAAGTSPPKSVRTLAGGFP